MLPARRDHARAALRFALDVHAAAAATSLPDSAVAAGGGGVLEHVQVRVGLHSGAVTAGVIGHLRARFCVFGGAALALKDAWFCTPFADAPPLADTVNVASRSTSQPACLRTPTLC